MSNKNNYSNRTENSGNCNYPKGWSYANLTRFDTIGKRSSGVRPLLTSYLLRTRSISSALNATVG